MAPLQPRGGHFGLILPLCTSSATVGLALFQYPVFLALLQPKPSIAGKPLSKYWEAFLAPGASLITSIAVTSAVSGLVCSRWLRTHTTLETTDVSKWYTYGAILAVGHFLAVPLIAGPIQRIIAAGKDGETSQADPEVDEANRKEMKTWLTVHTARTLFVDIPALWCFAEGAALAFWVI